MIGEESFFLHTLCCRCTYQVSSILFGGYYGTQYRVRLYPAFGYSILYKEYYLTRFNHNKNVTQV